MRSEEKGRYMKDKKEGREERVRRVVEEVVKSKKKEDKKKREWKERTRESVLRELISRDHCLLKSS